MLKFYSSLAVLAIAVGCGTLENHSKSEILSQSAVSNSSNIVVIGDSKTLGIFADMPGGAIVTDQVHGISGFAEFLVKGILWVAGPFDPDGEGSLNRSKMRAVQGIFARPKTTALLGDQDWSIPSRLGIKDGFVPKIINLSEPGLTFKMFSSWIFPEIEKLNSLEKNSIRYVFVDIGGVDFMVNQSLRDFQNDTNSAFNFLGIQFPNAKIVVSGIPNIVSILQDTERPASLKTDGTPWSTCGDEFKKNNLATKLRLGRDARAEDVSEASNRLEGFIKHLELEVEKEEIKDRSTFLPYPIISDWSSMTAMDCFHPNIAAQKIQSDFFWKYLENK